MCALSCLWRIKWAASSWGVCIILWYKLLVKRDIGLRAMPLCNWIVSRWIMIFPFSGSIYPMEVLWQLSGKDLIGKNVLMPRRKVQRTYLVSSTSPLDILNRSHRYVSLRKVRFWYIPLRKISGEFSILKLSDDVSTNTYDWPLLDPDDW